MTKQKSVISALTPFLFRAWRNTIPAANTKMPKAPYR